MASKEFTMRWYSEPGEMSDIERIIAAGKEMQRLHPTFVPLVCHVRHGAQVPPMMGQIKIETDRQIAKSDVHFGVVSTMEGEQ